MAIFAPISDGSDPCLPKLTMTSCLCRHGFAAGGACNQGGTGESTSQVSWCILLASVFQTLTDPPFPSDHCGMVLTLCTTHSIDMQPVPLDAWAASPTGITLSLIFVCNMQSDPRSIRQDRLPGYSKARASWVGLLPCR
jgi:hypothetical protein